MTENLRCGMSQCIDVLSLDFRAEDARQPAAISTPELTTTTWSQPSRHHRDRPHFFHLKLILAIEVEMSLMM